MPELLLLVSCMTTDGGCSLDGALIVMKTLFLVRCLLFWRFSNPFWMWVALRLRLRCMSQQYLVDIPEWTMLLWGVTILCLSSSGVRGGCILQQFLRLQRGTCHWCCLPCVSLCCKVIYGGFLSKLRSCSPLLQQNVSVSYMPYQLVLRA